METVALALSLLVASSLHEPLQTTVVGDATALLHSDQIHPSIQEGDSFSVTFSPGVFESREVSVEEGLVLNTVQLGEVEVGAQYGEVHLSYTGTGRFSTTISANQFGAPATVAGQIVVDVDGDHEFVYTCTALADGPFYPLNLGDAVGQSQPDNADLVGFFLSVDAASLLLAIQQHLSDNPGEYGACVLDFYGPPPQSDPMQRSVIAGYGAVSFSSRCRPSETDAGVSLECPEGTFEIEDGTDGTSCSVTQVEGGALIECEDGTSVMLPEGQDGTNGQDGQDGQDGEDGRDGLNGRDGRDGEDGKDGEACTVTENGDGTATMTCPDGSEATFGTAASSCSSSQAPSLLGLLSMLFLLGARQRRNRSTT